MTEFAPDHKITLTRTIAASAAAIYAAWTEPAIMEKWIASKVDADVRVGGEYRNTIDAGGQTFIHRGQYVALEPGRRLLQTFSGGVDEGIDEPSPYANEFIEVTLSQIESGETEMLFINGWNGPALDEETREATREGWSGWLDQLEALFQD